ncbi:MAG: 1-(5-phosphoribosyl)-5-[(5-phosphoribosylamino)methylideneamino]imidazole-4-carboxamide isomerase [Oscillospiraceae bacterium]|nr:1-(5-phosphoribosyl)-5-[(5-phosphoribosylamino)methylideneamino]imidazole-4-carboxamide isomerase [Oscillospiraceae bacterium]
MEIFPSVDIRGGKVVRLTEGSFNQMRVYSDSPEGAAEKFVGEGARNLHVVDLDGALEGKPVNYSAIRKLCMNGGLFVQVGGGIRDMARIDNYLSHDAGRVILGTVAVKNFSFVEEAVKRFGDKIAVGVDARDGQVAVSAWRDVTDVDSVEFCKRLKDVGVSTVIYTDIARDGRLSGTNLEIYRSLGSLAPLNIVASGGISFEREIAELLAIGTYGAILGKALYEGKLSLARAIAIADGAISLDENETLAPMP